MKGPCSETASRRLRTAGRCERRNLHSGLCSEDNARDRFGLALLSRALIQPSALCSVWFGFLRFRIRLDPNRKFFRGAARLPIIARHPLTPAFHADAKGSPHPEQTGRTGPLSPRNPDGRSPSNFHHVHERSLRLATKWCQPQNRLWGWEEGGLSPKPRGTVCSHSFVSVPSPHAVVLQFQPPDQALD